MRPMKTPGTAMRMLTTAGLESRVQLHVEHVLGPTYAEELACKIEASLVNRDEMIDVLTSCLVALDGNAFHSPLVDHIRGVLAKVGAD